MTNDTLERLHVLMQKEKATYSTVESLPEFPLHRDCVSLRSRRKMVAWCHHVAHHGNFTRDVAEVAVSLVDRYLVLSSLARSDRSLYQLVFLGALYISCKLHASKIVSANVLATLGRDEFTPEDIEDMEMEILRTLKWRICPPTSSYFLAEFLLLIPTHTLSPGKLVAINDLTIAQVDVAIAHSARTRKSRIVLAALLNSLETLEWEEGTLSQVATTLTQAAGVGCNSPHLVELQKSLSRWTTACCEVRLHATKRRTTRTPSPKCRVRRLDLSPRGVISRAYESGDELQTVR